MIQGFCHRGCLTLVEDLHLELANSSSRSGMGLILRQRSALYPSSSKQQWRGGSCWLACCSAWHAVMLLSPSASRSVFIILFKNICLLLLCRLCLKRIRWVATKDLPCNLDPIVHHLLQSMEFTGSCLVSFRVHVSSLLESKKRIEKTNVWHVRFVLHDCLSWLYPIGHVQVSIDDEDVVKARDFALAEIIKLSDRWIPTKNI